VQDVREQTLRQIKTIFGDVRFQPALADDTPVLSQHGMVNSAAPNFVHSYDAAAQSFCVADLHAQGIRSFLSVHDSFGTHAGNAWPLYQSIRETFVAMYSSWDVLDALSLDTAQGIGEIAMEDYPDNPSMGDLEISSVLASEFFFA
jgi:DNA-directed RNA polymerase